MDGHRFVWVLLFGVLFVLVEPVMQCTLCLSNVDFGTFGTRDRIDKVGAPARERSGDPLVTLRGMQDSGGVYVAACSAHVHRARACAGRVMVPA